MFEGPAYAVVEIVFDEDDIAECDTLDAAKV